MALSRATKVKPNASFVSHTKPYFVFGIALLLSSILSAVEVTALQKGFLNPPHDAKPQIWWHWMNGNVTREGIVADLDAMQQVGIGGAFIFDVGWETMIPTGPLAFNSPEWFEMIRFAVAEAQKRGIEISLPNCSGWSSSGGPWVPLEMSMKELAWTSTRVVGPTKFSGKINPAPNEHGFYEDICVMAVPVPPAEKSTMFESGAVVTREGEKNVWTITFPEPYEAAGLNVRFDYPKPWCDNGEMRVFVSSDGTTFSLAETREIPLAQSGTFDTSLRYYSFRKRLRGKSFRLEFNLAPHLKVKVCDLELTKKMAISELNAKIVKYRLPFKIEQAETTPDQIVPKNAFIDLTSQIKKDNTLVWDVPAGDWKIIRLGYVSLGYKNHPASKFGAGYEVDKLSAEALNFHFDQYAGKLCRMLGELAGGKSLGLKGILVDSYEVGSQNWTKGLEQEFARRTGYEMKPYYPVLTGVVVGSLDESERFLWDFRRVLADLFSENYAGALAKKCHTNGLNLILEPYGNGPMDNLQYGQFADIPMGEVWSGRGFGRRGSGNARYVSSLAHTWGRKYAAMEAFTGPPWNGSRWQITPFHLKAQGDYIFSQGINRLVIHSFVHQPWADDQYAPGLTLGKYGIHFNRLQTWWPLARDWIRYLTRCQYLLQEGKPVVDVLYYCGESAPNLGGSTDGTRVKPFTLPKDYTWDFCTREVVKALSVKDGKIIAPGGVAYHLLVLEDEAVISREMLEAIERLVAAGGKVVARGQPRATPGLVGYSPSDNEITSRIHRLWEKVLSCSPAEVLTRLEITPDFRCDNPRVSWTHRRYDDNFDGYFVALDNRTNETIDCSFKMSGRIPELWDAETGRIVEAPVWREENGRTSVQLNMQPSGSVFVMFQQPANGRKGNVHAPVKWDVLGLPFKVTGAWDVAFQPNRGAPPAARFEKLISWTDHPDAGIKYFSGSATYRKKISLGRVPKANERVILDLGEVKDFAEISINGAPFVLRWKPPFEMDVTESLRRTKGELEVVIRITNRWVNRLIGDEFLPPHCEWAPKHNWREGIVEIPDWVKKGEKSPTGRITFAAWHHWYKTDALLPSGLLGPVTLRTEARQDCHGALRLAMTLAVPPILAAENNLN